MLNETEGEVAALNPPSGGDIKGVAYIKGRKMKRHKKMSKRMMKKEMKREHGRS